MGEFNLDDQENTNRRIAEALERIAVALEGMKEGLKEELGDIKENIRHKVKMDSK